MEGWMLGITKEDRTIIDYIRQKAEDVIQRIKSPK